MSNNLIETLAAELERPRELSARVLSYIEGTYGVDHVAIGTFLVEKLPDLEDDDIDLILSPLFTPRLSDQAIFAELLCAESVSRQQWPSLIQQLVARPTLAQLMTPDSQLHSVRLRDVTVQRYVPRLRLEGTISEPVLKLLDRIPSAADLPMLKAIARRAVWENLGVREIFVCYLTNVMARGSYSLADVLDLLNLVEGRKPANLPDLLARIPGWREALRQQVEVVGGSKPFFIADIEMMHGGGRDKRGQNESLVSVSAKQKDLEFLDRLQQILAG